MMLKKITLLLSFAVSGCMLAPVEQEPRWTDEVLQELPESSAPEFIPTVQLSQADRSDLEANDLEVRVAGDVVREEGEEMRAQESDTEAFATEQRARAQEPN